MNIQCKRVYDPAEQSDGYRVLVDRLWPRGIKKTDLALDEWDKEITPSTKMPEAFHGEVVDFATFREQYLAELAQHEQEGKRLATCTRRWPLPQHNHHPASWCWPSSLPGFNINRRLFFTSRMITVATMPIHQWFHRPVICNCC